MRDYEAMLEDFYLGLLRPGDHCIDVGAHLGRHAFPMSRRVGTLGSVRAFEPLPRLAAELRAAIASDKSLGNVHLTECALSEASGETEFVLVHEAPGYSGLRERRYDSEVTTERIRVKLHRLDDFLPDLPAIRYIKIDCEGAELLVDGRPLYQHVAEKVARDWNGNGNCALVVGATWPEQLRDVRAIVGDVPFLVPGVGAQGGDAGAVVRNARTADGTGLIISSSRAVLYASAGEDYAEAAAAPAKALRDEKNSHP